MIGGLLSSVGGNPTDVRVSGCVHEQVAKRIANVFFAIAETPGEKVKEFSKDVIKIAVYVAVAQGLSH